MEVKYHYSGVQIVIVNLPINIKCDVNRGKCNLILVYDQERLQMSDMQMSKLLLQMKY